MTTTKLKPGSKIYFNKLNRVIREFIPHGFSINEKPHKSYLERIDFDALICRKELKRFSRIELALGSLGGGNHFIGLNEDDKGDHYLVIHSGSRNLGKQVAELYQEKAVNSLFDREAAIQDIVHKLKEEGRHREIQPEVEKIKKKHASISNSVKDLASLQGQQMKDYLNDMKIAQK